MTNDGDSLFRAICEQPWEDTPRLVYADWLEENGDPLRAEFIRVQIALANNPTGPQRVSRLIRAKELQRASQGRWTRGSPAGRGIRIGRELRRGFYHQVAFASVPLFLARARSAFDWTPVDALWVSKATDATLREMLTVSHLARLTRLTISESSFGDEGFRAVAECSSLARLTQLRVWGSQQVGDAGVIELSSSPALANVRELSISANRCTDAGAVALINSPYLTRVEALELHNVVGLSDAVTAALKRHFPRYGQHPSYGPT